MAKQVRKSFCRICLGFCGSEVVVDEQGRLETVRGDKDHPMTKGYMCIKGLQAPASHNQSDRLLRPLKRQADGQFTEIALEVALDEIAAKMGELGERHGSDSIAAYRGTATAQNAVVYQMTRDWLDAMGSNSLFTTLTIDQSAKWVTADRTGVWEAGINHMYDSDVMMLIGVNPLMSLTCIGFDCTHPLKKLQEFKSRGGCLIVVDPRLSETARHADIFLQPYPGEDPTVASGLLRLILTNNWHDSLFCDGYVSQMDELRRAVERFDPEYVEHRAGVRAADLHKAAEAFAKDGNRGCALTGTGPNMAARSNLTEHLYQALNIICGRFNRAGEPVRNPGVLSPPMPVRAQVVPPTRSWESGWKSRVRNLGLVAGEKVTGSLAEEILTPGPGQIRSLTVIGGNPASAVPDSQRIYEALSDLDLLVVIDPFMTNTARIAHYVIPPTLQYERADLWGLAPLERMLNALPFSQFTEAIAAPPPNSDLAQDWYVFWAIAKRLLRVITFNGVELPINEAPSTLRLIEIMAKDSRIPLQEIKSYASGKIFDFEQRVEPEGDIRHKFEVMPPDVYDELVLVADEGLDSDGRTPAFSGYPFRLASRRMREVYNSQGRNLPDAKRRRPYNPAFLNPIDIDRCGLHPGAKIHISSEFGEIPAIVESDDTVRQGVVSMSHGWGGLPMDELSYQTDGSSVGMLISSQHYVESINAMPRMSGIPVQVHLVYDECRDE